LEFGAVDGGVDGKYLDRFAAAMVDHQQSPAIRPGCPQMEAAIIEQCRIGRAWEMGIGGCVGGGLAPGGAIRDVSLRAFARLTFYIITIIV